MSPISQFAAETLSRVIVIDELSHRSWAVKREEVLEFWPLQNRLLIILGLIAEGYFTWLHRKQVVYKGLEGSLLTWLQAGGAHGD